MPIYNVFTHVLDYEGDVLENGNVKVLDPRVVYEDRDKAQALADSFNREILTRMQNSVERWNARIDEQGLDIPKRRPYDEERLVREPGYCWVEEIEIIPRNE